MVDPREPVRRSNRDLPQTHTTLDQHFPTSVINSGTVTAINGERFVPSSTRPDGSRRTERKIRTGYTPPEDIEKYRAPPLGLELAGRRDSKALTGGAHANSWPQSKVPTVGGSPSMEYVITHTPLPIDRETSVVVSNMSSKISSSLHPEQRGLLAASSGGDNISVGGAKFPQKILKPRVTYAELEPLSFNKPAEYLGKTLGITEASRRAQSEVLHASVDESNGHLIVTSRRTCRTDPGQHLGAHPVNEDIQRISLPVNHPVATITFTQQPNELQRIVQKAAERPDHINGIQRRRPLWYTPDYVIGVKADKEYLKKSDTLRVITYKPLSRPEYTPAIVDIAMTNDFLSALKQQWFLAMQQARGA
ncbi:MAG: hypothetical protein M1830_003774 [Pleopsidium flavum]|nr:MAG: hypothetical protein M1830_003774 [Pleopsidium flavum]